MQFISEKSIVTLFHNSVSAYKEMCSSHAGYFNQTEIEKIMEESLKMKNFNHRHVMNLIGLCLDAGPAPYIVMPYMANGSLLHYLRRERSSLVLKDDADEDQVTAIALWSAYHRIHLHSHMNTHRYRRFAST